MKRIFLISISVLAVSLICTSCIGKAVYEHAQDSYSYEFDYAESDAGVKAEIPEEAEIPEVAEEMPEVLPEPVLIEADFEVSVNEDNSFNIITNLPVGTELSLKLQGRGYLAQGKAFVEEGITRSEPFTNRGNQLVGEYTLEVMMPIPNVQSDYVKHFIGERGEYLTGPYIKGALGTVIVSKEFEVTLPGKPIEN